MRDHFRQQILVKTTKIKLRKYIKKCLQKAVKKTTKNTRKSHKNLLKMCPWGSPKVLPKINCICNRFLIEKSSPKWPQERSWRPLGGLLGPLGPLLGPSWGPLARFLDPLNGLQASLVPPKPPKALKRSPQGAQNGPQTPPKRVLRRCPNDQFFDQLSSYQRNNLTIQRSTNPTSFKARRNARSD